MKRLSTSLMNMSLEFELKFWYNKGVVENQFFILFIPFFGKPAG